jgi:DNA replication protein DnaC
MEKKKTEIPEKIEIDLTDIKKEVNRSKPVEIDDPVLQAKISDHKIKTHDYLKGQGVLPPNKAIRGALINFLADTRMKIRKKGLFLIGDVGTGKTVALKIIQKYRNINKFYKAADLSEGRKHDPHFIEEAFRNMVGDSGTYIIDDIGAELEINDYGVKSEFMIEVINKRHLDFLEKGHITLFSSNLGPEAFENRYSKRILDRILEMCEIVYCQGESLRR